MIEKLFFDPNVSTPLEIRIGLLMEKKITNKAPAVCRKVFSQVAAVYSLHGAEDSIYRRFSWALICLASGRAGEAATATWNLSVRDDVVITYKCISFLLPCFALRPIEMYVV